MTQMPTNEAITTRLLSMSEAMWMDRDHDELDALLLEAKGEIERLDAERDAAIGKRRVWVEWCTRVLRHHRQMIKDAEARADNAEKRCAELEAALRPFALASVATTVFNDWETVDDTQSADMITLGDLRRAAALIPQQKGNADG
jgi:hypothetical protein